MPHTSLKLTRYGNRRLAVPTAFGIRPDAAKRHLLLRGSLARMLELFWTSHE